MGQDWVEFTEETSTRFVNGDHAGAVNLLTDNEEKDFITADFDQDGDLDLVIVRKQPFTSTGRRTNQFLMNEGIADGHPVDGVLVDRTDEFATDSPDDNGFLTPMNDRDVEAADVNNDGWIDLITAVTLTDNATKTESHPRIYINKGEIGGVWQGFVYEPDRIPLLHPNVNAGPRFCSVRAGDVTGDGYVDLYFGDYDSGGSQLVDFDNRLLINRGASDPGVFDDGSTARMNSTMLNSAFGASSSFADINGDGVMDIAKQTSLNAPLHIAVIYNNPANEGFFNLYDTVDSNAPYFVTAADLNNDGDPDLIVTDDGNDRIWIQTNLDGQGQANFTSVSLGIPTAGFGGDNYAKDLNNDGWLDIIITDVDVDISGCNRTSDILRNLQNPNGAFAPEGQPIPDSNLTGVHDAAIFDLNGDGWLDIVLGRCGGNEIWMNVPPAAGLAFSYPGGVPNFLTSGQTTEIELRLSGIGTSQPEPNSAKMNYSLNGAPYVQVAMTPTGLPNQYTVDMPAFECNDEVDFYFEALEQGGSTLTDPGNAPAVTFSALVADSVTTDRQEFETAPAPGWTTEENNLQNGYTGWAQTDPNGTLSGGNQAAPEDDATQAADATMCFHTGAQSAGATAGNNDVDGGPSYLISPALDFSNADGQITWSQWFFSSTGTPDVMTVEVSNDNGQTWTPAPELTATGTNSQWELAGFTVSDYVAPTNEVRVRFGVSDLPNDSITEAGIDNFETNIQTCDDGTCPGDIDGNGAVDIDDVVGIILDFGSNGDGNMDGFNGDVDQSGLVDIDDVIFAVLAFGPCDPI